MADKKAQAIVKRDSLTNWQKAKNYIPNVGVIIVVDMPDGSTQIRFGNGEDYVNDLPNLLENSNTTNAPTYDNEILEFK